jgi:hypothetical protein
MLIVSMRPQMDALLKGKRLKDRPDLGGMSLHQITALPSDQRGEIYRWFFLPEDAHYTDYGISLYQREVAKYLIRNGSQLSMPLEINSASRNRDRSSFSGRR